MSSEHNISNAGLVDTQVEPLTLYVSAGRTHTVTTADCIYIMLFRNETKDKFSIDDLITWFLEKVIKTSAEIK